MKKITILAAVAAAMTVACNPEQKSEQLEITFTLSEKNVEVKGLDYDFIVNVDNTAKSVEIYADYLDAENIKALDVVFTGLEEGVSVNYLQVFNYANGQQDVTFVKQEKEFVYNVSAVLGKPSPVFLDLSVAGVAVAGGEVKLSGSTDLSGCVVEYTLSPADTKVFVGETEISSGAAVDFSDKLNGVTFTLKCSDVSADVTVKAVTTGINSVTRVWGHYVKPDSCTDDWFGTKVTATLDMIRNVALTDEYIILSKDKEKLKDASGQEYVDRAGCYAVRISDPSDVKVLSREGFDDNTRFFSVTTVDNTIFLPTFVMAAGGHLIMYRYDNVNSDPVVALDYVLPQAMRLGDKITSEGTLENGRIYLYDTTSAQKVLCFLISGGKIAPEPIVIDLDTKMGNYGAVYRYDDTHYICACTSCPSAMFTVSGTTASKEFDFLGSKYGYPVHGFEVLDINEEQYLAFVNLRSSFQDGQFRIMPISGGSLEEKINCESNPFVYYLGDPQTTEDGTRLKNGNGLGSGDFRVIDGHNYYAAYVPGTGLSLFEIK